MLQIFSSLLRLKFKRFDGLSSLKDGVISIIGNRCLAKVDLAVSYVVGTIPSPSTRKAKLNISYGVNCLTSLLKLHIMFVAVLNKLADSTRNWPI